MTMALIFVVLLFIVSSWAAAAVSAAHPPVAEAEVTALHALVIRRRSALLSEANCLRRTIDWILR